MHYTDNVGYGHHILRTPFRHTVHSTHDWIRTGKADGCCYSSHVAPNLAIRGCVETMLVYEQEKNRDMAFFN